ncbi:MAG: alpha/beta hydrolase [Myxococcota bacterium]
MLALETGRVRAGGLEFAYDAVGSGSPPLVLIHGYMAHRADFRDVLPMLGARRRVIAYDLRGHGDSDRGPAERYTLDTLADDLGRMLDQLGIGQIHLLGHSMGGMVAHRFVLAAPDRVRSLILSSTTAHPVTLSPAITQSMPRALLDRAAGGWEKVDAAGARVLRADFGRVPSLVSTLATIRCPTLGLVGELDPQFRTPTAELAALIPGAQLVELGGVSHQPHLEAPARFVEELERFLGP